MTISRRHVVAGGAGAMALGAGMRGRRAHAADDYPNKPILLVVGFAAGGSADITARIIAEGLSNRLNQSVVVENKTGASATIALEYTAKSRPDGYTLSITSGDATSMLWAVKPKAMPFDLHKDLTFISRIVELDYPLVVNTKWPFKTLAEFVAYAKANPGKLRCGNIGYGSGTHLTALLFEQQAGIKMTYVPYRGGMATMPDILAGNIDCAFLTVMDVLSAGKTDKITELAVASPVREALLPGVPTMAEAGYPGAAATSWLGLIGPSNLPQNVLNRLDKAIADVVVDPGVKDKLNKLALRSATLTGDAFRKAVVDEYDTWAAVAKKADMTTT